MNAERIEQRISSLSNWATRHRLNAMGLESLAKQLRRQGEENTSGNIDYCLIRQADRVYKNAQADYRKVEALEDKISNLREKLAQMAFDS